MPKQDLRTSSSHLLFPYKRMVYGVVVFFLASTANKLFSAPNVTDVNYSQNEDNGSIWGYLILLVIIATASFFVVGAKTYIEHRHDYGAFPNYSTVKEHIVKQAEDLTGIVFLMLIYTTPLVFIGLIPVTFLLGVVTRHAGVPLNFGWGTFIYASVIISSLIGLRSGYKDITRFKRTR